MEAQPVTAADSVAVDNKDIKTDMASHEGPVDVKKGTLLEIDATREITSAEHELKFWDAVRQYPMAVFWALFFCIAVIMAGFDAQIITSFYALPSFQTHYGSLFEGEYIITAPWQTGKLFFLRTALEPKGDGRFFYGCIIFPPNQKIY